MPTAAAGASWRASRRRARSRRPLDVGAARTVRPVHPGITELDDVPLSELVETIDWSPFFHAWEMKGRYPEILDDPALGNEARKLLSDARALLARIVGERAVRARAVAGLWPANRVGDDIEVYADDARSVVAARFLGLRQQTRKRPGQTEPRARRLRRAPRGTDDWIGGFAVTAGHGVERLVTDFERDHDDYNAILVKALADRLAEALAEWLHQRVRRELWGYAPNEVLEQGDLVRERYRGIRPAPGYPAQPDHTEKRTLFRLLDAERRTGIHLTESLAMTPPSSVCGLVPRASRRPLLRRRQPRPRSARGLRRAQGHGGGRGRALARTGARLRAGSGAELNGPTGSVPDRRADSRTPGAADGVAPTHRPPRPAATRLSARPAAPHLRRAATPPPRHRAAARPATTSASSRARRSPRRRATARR